MNSESFFNTLQDHYNKELPFVAYCKPNAYEIVMHLQKDDSLYKIDDYTENGFIFSPFDIRKDAILIPFSRSKTLKVDTEFLTHDEFDQKEFTLIEGKQEHIELVDKGIQAISKGDIKKVVLSRSEIISVPEFDLVKTFIRLLNTNNLAFVYCWYHPKVGLWIGATPEKLLLINKNSISTTSLAGTQKYEGILEVTWQDKEKDEQQLVTKYIVDNLKKFAGAIKLSDPNTVKAGNVLHIKTDISAVINTKSFNLKQLINSLHPTPAVCGYPKIEAMQFILDNESYNREFYTGFLGELNFETDREGIRGSELFVNLRCMQIVDRNAIVYVGGGITHASNSESEWQETVFKANTMKNVIAF